MILREENIPIEADGMQRILLASNIEIPAIYAQLMAKFLNKDDNLQRILQLPTSKQQEQTITTNNTNTDDRWDQMEYGISDSEQNLFGVLEF